jgi:hypothetical protein
MQIAATSEAAEPFDRLLALISYTGAVGIANRNDITVACMDAVEAFSDPLTEDQDRLLAEYLLSIPLVGLINENDASAARASASLRAIADRIDDDHINLLADTASVLSLIRRVPPDRSLTASELLYARAINADNHFVGWIVASAGTSLALAIGDAERGLQWSDRTLEGLGDVTSGESGGVLELRGCVLALTQDWLGAARLLSAARAHGQRGGASWPQWNSTRAVLDLINSNLSTDEQARAHHEGSRLSVPDLLRPDRRLHSARSRPPQPDILAS